jgi:hypothetical protein
MGRSAQKKGSNRQRRKKRWTKPAAFDREIVEKRKKRNLKTKRVHGTSRAGPYLRKGRFLLCRGRARVYIGVCVCGGCVFIAKEERSAKNRILSQYRSGPFALPAASRPGRFLAISPLASLRACALARAARAAAYWHLCRAFCRPSTKARRERAFCVRARDRKEEETLSQP